MKISFNLRLRYDECQDCIKFIKSIGGYGNITVGGSWYTGTKKQIQDLIIYMGEKKYDLDSMSINKDPKEATQERINELKQKGII